MTSSHVGKTHAPQADIDVKLLFNLCTLVTTNAKCYVRTDRFSLKGIFGSVIYLIKMRINNSSVYKVSYEQLTLNCELKFFPQNCCESITVASLFSPGRDWPHPLHVCTTRFVITFLYTQPPQQYGRVYIVDCYTQNNESLFER